MSLHQSIAEFISAESIPGASNDHPLLVYRNTVRLAEREALALNYPCVLSLAGEAAFAQLATRYAQHHQLHTASLWQWGHDFPAFLKDKHQSLLASEYAYFSEVSVLDQLYTESLFARDAPNLELSELDLAVAGQWLIHPHPSARSQYFADTPSAAFWMALKQDESDLSGIAWVGSGALITRPKLKVNIRACCALEHELFQFVVAQQPAPLTLEQTLASFIDHGIFNTDFLSQHLVPALQALIEAGALTYTPFDLGSTPS